MPKPDFSIDEPSYQEGRAAFAAGVRLRDIVDDIMAVPTAGIDKNKLASSALGFFDALLDHLRGINAPSKAV